ncbi:hypothetical protein H257_00454 [Aphanomyces astaci]|uniref:Uncharacterized protein n=1 Tax=Aphanomyces astaci TaxID=112090 RepID=W4HAP9_APHAT|nr:hypothetical protein H257_00454 [Aphanomyces astaci]ETV89070.1 hypothetical protein H257_00454 [Aphanomyces astaci]|eukprot:XP_009821470.1 hypothetical protein H257_00454 [Aphanomyces astaci]
MQATADAVRRRWPLAAGVTATATALVLAGFQAYTTPLNNRAKQQAEEAASSAAESSSNESAGTTLIPPRTPSPRKRGMTHTSVIHAPHFHYFLAPIVLGLFMGIYIVLLHFGFVDTSSYPSVWDIAARSSLLHVGVSHGLVLWPFLTETPRLRFFRISVMEWLASSSFMDIYVTSHIYFVFATIVTPMTFLLLEAHWQVISWSDGQFYVLLAVSDLTASSVLWHYYTLAHLNSDLRHL